MPKKSTNLKENKKQVEKKNTQSNSILKVESKIDSKVAANKVAKVTTSEIKKEVVIPEVKEIKVEVATKKAKDLKETDSKKVAAKPKAESSAKPKAASKPKKAASKAASKVEKSEKAKVATKDTKKVATKVQDKAKKNKVNYLELLGEDPIKVVVTEENKTVSNYPVKVALKNYGFLKTVKVKYTEDNWKTSLEKDLIFKSQDENNIEEWNTIIELTSKDKANFQYVVSYEVNDEIYWDNNSGSNYLF